MLDGKFYVLDSDEDSSDEELYGSKANKSNNQTKKERQFKNIQYKRNLKKAQDDSDDDIRNLNDHDK